MLLALNFSAYNFQYYQIFTLSEPSWRIRSPPWRPKYRPRRSQRRPSRRPKINGYSLVYCTLHTQGATHAQHKIS